MNRFFTFSFLLFFLFFGYDSLFSNDIVSFSAVGDIMAHDNLQEYLLSTPQGYNSMFKYTKEYFLDDDFTFANLEVPIHDGMPIAGYPQFNAKKELLDAMESAGIDILSLANNHSFDKGYEGMTETVKGVKKHNFIFSGVGENPSESREVVYFTKNNIKFAFISTTAILNGFNVVEDKSKSFVYLVPLENKRLQTLFLEKISSAKKSADIVIVSYHSGIEYTNTPDPLQKEVYYNIAEAGADIILGHHPHVLQPVEFYKTKDERETLIAFSLGNFASAQARYDLNKKGAYNSLQAKTADSVILKFDVVKIEDKTAIINTSIIPLYNVRFAVKQYYNKRLISEGFATVPIDDLFADENRFGLNISEGMEKFILYRYEKIKTLLNVPLYEKPHVDLELEKLELDESSDSIEIKID